MCVPAAPKGYGRTRAPIGGRRLYKIAHKGTGWTGHGDLDGDHMGLRQSLDG
jgi:hypothetical protein